MPCGEHDESVNSRGEARADRRGTICGNAPALFMSSRILIPYRVFRRAADPLDSSICRPVSHAERPFRVNNTAARNSRALASRDFRDTPERIYR